jgi:hypothetical protein
MKLWRARGAEKCLIDATSVGTRSTMSSRRTERDQQPSSANGPRTISIPQILLHSGTGIRKATTALAHDMERAFTPSYEDLGVTCVLAAAESFVALNCLISTFCSATFCFKSIIALSSSAPRYRRSKCVLFERRYRLTSVRGCYHVTAS